ncbi:MAG: hypothetical protein PUA49_05545 [Butyrivibrio sp.]|nr:hypothetical protein [Butyrivibrio sp.]
MKAFAKLKKPIIITLLVALAVSYYVYLTHRKVDNSEKMASESVQSELLSRDMNKNYPSDYYDVVDYFTSMQKVCYKEDISDDEIVGFVQHMRAMLDDELLSKNGNDYQSYLTRFKDEIEAYKSKEQYINEYQMQRRRDITQYTMDSKNYAEVSVKYYVRTGSKLTVMYQKYTLRKGTDSKWKILFWELSDGADMKDE